MTKQAKFMWNNFAAQPETTKTFSSQASGYPFTNVVDPLRSRVWRTAGNFTITDANNKIYIDDGAGKTVTLTNGNYTAATLASHIQAQLNAASSGWTVAYTSNKFTLTNSGSVTVIWGSLTIEQPNNDGWSGLGVVNPNFIIGNTFKSIGSGNLEKIILHMKNDLGTTGNLEIKIYATSAGFPTGAALAISDPIDTTTISASGQDVDFVFSTLPALTNGTTYAWTMKATHSGATIGIRSAWASTTYSDGNAIYSVNNGSSWGSNAGDDWEFYAHYQDIFVNQVYDTLGFAHVTGSTTSTSFVADEIRIHTDEWCDFDFGINVDLSFLGLVGKSNAMFSPSSSATMTLMLNNLPNAWDTPAKTITLTRTDEGVFQVFDLESYRYARFKVVDATNPKGFLEFSYCYLGDHTTFTKTNIQNGFSKTIVDPSVVSYADSGVPYFRRKTKYKRMDNVTVAFASTSERTEFELFWNECGLTSPFFAVFDPELCVTSSINDLSGLFFFDGDPVFNHNFSQYFDIAFNLRETL